MSFLIEFKMKIFKMVKKILPIFILIFSISNSYANENSSNVDEFAEYEKEFSTSEEEVYDPFEKVNRKIFVFNDFIDRNVLTPVARAYGNYVPKVLRKSIHNFTNNLTLPISTLNSFAQGKVDNGLATFSNFLINTTLGVGGIFDVAGNKNITYEEEDFGQTFGHYGAKSGPYLMLPLIGPSNLRDVTGSGFSTAVDPMGFNLFQVGGSRNYVSAELRISNTLFSSVDKRESLLKVTDDLRKESFDLYATVRSLYIQTRTTKISK